MASVKPIDKIVYSTLPPKFTDVVWMDITDLRKPVIKAYLGGIWTPVTSKADEIDFETLTPEEVINLLQL